VKQNDPRPDVAAVFIHQETQTALREAACSEWPQLRIDDAAVILERLAANLWRYRRPVGDGQGFLKWATGWTIREARRLRFLSELRSTYDDLMIAAIVRGLYRAPEDLAVEPKDHISDLILHLLEHPRKIDGLLSPRSGKPSSVLYALAQSRIRGFRAKIARRRGLVEERLRLGYSIDCELALTEEEIAAVSASAPIRQAECELSAVA
jgi:hypothetical protein